MNCLDYLKSRNYNLEGYSPDTYYFLFNTTPSHPSSECEGLFAYLQACFG